MKGRRPAARYAKALFALAREHNQTELIGRYNRAHWLVIDKLGATEGETAFPDTAYLFPERKPSGRVDLARRGNTIEASTQGVKEFTLLLSPDAFDFNSPVKVLTNGRVAFDNNQIPANRISPIAKQLLSFIPLPNFAAPLGQNNFVQAQTREKTTDGFDGKINYTASSKDQSIHG